MTCLSVSRFLLSRKEFLQSHQAKQDEENKDLGYLDLTSISSFLSMGLISPQGLFAQKRGIAT
ncbi:hypothetical protein HQ47_10240 [Porphyromonas macacae]|uniref:Uncharacterized protein n=1 Tax=Porphyromonas macacae TaxID=28115 RepID=A0A0A2E070_9PORP|nr:hypothetical protein [Porphyromonas macacae]KGN72313.1 hypothetical protein HQ47_10240 [Porphyromonas macacae]